jgi:hypothetical protein
MAGTHFRPTEQPVPSSQGNGANFPFQMIGSNGHMRVGQKHVERGFPLQGIPRGVGEGMGGQEHLGNHGLFEPGKEGFDERVRVLTAVRELGVGL